MDKQALNPEEMQELIDMGIDVSNASMYWTPENYLDVIRNEHDRDAIPDLGFTYTFTLQDILEILPRELKPFTGNKYWKKVWFELLPYAGNRWCAAYENPSELFCRSDGKTPLEAAFNMLKWCKQHNMLNNGQKD